MRRRGARRRHGNARCLTAHALTRQPTRRRPLGISNTAESRRLAAEAEAADAAALESDKEVVVETSPSQEPRGPDKSDSEARGEEDEYNDDTPTNRNRGRDTEGSATPVQHPHYLMCSWHHL